MGFPVCCRSHISKHGHRTCIESVEMNSNNFVHRSDSNCRENICKSACFRSTFQKHKHRENFLKLLLTSTNQCLLRHIKSPLETVSYFRRLFYKRNSEVLALATLFSTFPYFSLRLGLTHFCVSIIALPQFNKKTDNRLWAYAYANTNFLRKHEIIVGRLALAVPRAQFCLLTHLGSLRVWKKRSINDGKVSRSIIC